MKIYAAIRERDTDIEHQFSKIFNCPIYICFILYFNMI